jgi:hypothetical protein
MIIYPHQEAFNIIWEHAKKGVKSTKRSVCMYRGPNGAKCFIGALIPDERYLKEMDQTIIYFKGVLDRAAVAVDASPKSIGEIQSIHDRYQPEEWTARLAIYASDHGLTVPA